MGQKVGKEDREANFAVVRTKVPSMKDSQLDDLWKLFAKHCDKEGKLSKPALKKMLSTDDALVTFGNLAVLKGLTDDEKFESLFRAFDVDNSGAVDFVECAILVFVVTTDDEVEKLKMYFRMFDVDNTRTITLSDLQKAKDSRLFPGIDPAALLAVVDPNKTGSVSEESWVEHLKNNLEMRATFDHKAESELAKQKRLAQCPDNGFVVQTLTGKTFYISDLTPQSKLSDVHEKIQDSQGIPPPQQLLWSSGHRHGSSDADKTLEELNIPLKSELRLQLTLRG